MRNLSAHKEHPCCLIINADDYGFTHGVSLGIRECIEAGCITSVTVLMNYLDDTDALALYHLQKKFPFGVGLHLNLSQGRMLTYSDRVFDGQILEDSSLVENEIEAQLTRFVNFFNMEPDHIDVHHHLHYDLRLLSILIPYCKSRNLPLRHIGDLMRFVIRANGVNTPDRFINVFPLQAPPESFSKHLQTQTVALCTTISDETRKAIVVEWMTHPGYNDAKLESLALGYSSRREIELALLLQKEFLVQLREAQVTLTSFGKICGGY